MKDDSNRREFTRVPLHIDVEVIPNQSGLVSYHVRDVSLNGLYLQCDKPLPLGTNCQVTLLLGEKENPVRIKVNGKVTRVNPDGMGLEITEIIGSESFAHLRNLVLYNASNIDQVEEEFHSHLGIKRRD